MGAREQELVDSYYRCRSDEQFLDTFYDLFLAQSPTVAQKFANTDFNLQKLLLRQSLLEMLGFDRGLPGSIEEIERLGHRHRELGITAEMYTMWLDSLCQSIRQHDPEYTPGLERHWRDAMLKSISKMLAAGDSHEPDVG